jgi:hypothetical protein
MRAGSKKQLDLADRENLAPVIFGHDGSGKNQNRPNIMSDRRERPFRAIIRANQ